MVNHHASIPSKDGSSGRHLNLAEGLAKHGWNASLIIASTKHPTGEPGFSGMVRKGMTVEKNTKVLWIRSNSYRNGGIARILGMMTFALNLCAPGATSTLEKPDIVLGSTVHPLAAWAASVLARRNRVPFVFEVRDVWPDALIELNAISSRGIVAKALRALMSSLAKRADLVVAPLPYISRWLEEQDLEDKPFVWVSNGTAVENDTPPVTVPERETFTLMYLGSHGSANVLDTILDAFDDACQLRPELKLCLRLIGEGPKKQQLVEYAKSLRSSQRISFEERIPQSQVKSRAREADAMISALHDSPVYKYGIGSNKLFTYLDSGRPTIWASSAPNNPIKEANAGLCVASDDREALVAAIIEMAETSAEDRTQMAQRGWLHVRENYSFDVLGYKLAEALDQVVNDPGN